MSLFSRSVLKFPFITCPVLGLSEVIAGMGTQKLEKFMPDLVKTAEAPDIASHIRDGYLMMFIYLPGTFGDKFADFVGPLISPILIVSIERMMSSSIPQRCQLMS